MYQTQRDCVGVKKLRTACMTTTIIVIQKMIVSAPLILAVTIQKLFLPCIGCTCKSIYRALVIVGSRGSSEPMDFWKLLDLTNYNLQKKSEGFRIV